MKMPEIAKVEKANNQARRDTVTEIIAALLWGGKTIDQLIEFTGCAEMTAREWVHAFHRSGLVRIAGRLPREKAEGAQQYARRRVVWEWQNTPFANPDVTP